MSDASGRAHHLSNVIIKLLGYFSRLAMYILSKVVLCRVKDAEIEPELMDLIRRLKKTSTDLFSHEKVYWQYKFCSNIMC